MSTSGTGQPAQFLSAQEPAPATLPHHVANLLKGDPGQQLEAAAELRKLLTVPNLPIDQVIATGVLPHFVAILANDQHEPALHFQVVWALTNIALGSSDHVRAIVEAGAVPVLVRLLAGSPSNKVREQVLWALGSVIIDSPECRDLVLDSGAVPALVSNLAHATQPSILRLGTWALANLCCCHSRRPPNFELVRPALRILAWLVLNSTHEEVLTDACRALSYLSDGPTEHVQAVVEAGAVEGLVGLLRRASASRVQARALRALANITAGEEHQTQVVLNCGILPLLHSLLTQNLLCDLACWVVSNITAGTQDQIQEVIDAELIPPLVQLMRTSDDYNVQKDATWALHNITSGGSLEQVRYVVQQGCIEAVCRVLALPPPVRADPVRSSEWDKLLCAALDMLENVLWTDQAHHMQFEELVNDSGAVDSAVNSEGVQAKAIKILDTYFPADEDDIMGDAEAQGSKPFNLGPPHASLPQ